MILSDETKAAPRTARFPIFHRSRTPRGWKDVASRILALAVSAEQNARRANRATMYTGNP